jgi:YesN/AraC family two-component response regulator
MMVKEELKNLGLQSEYINVELGVVEVLQDITEQQVNQLKQNLLISGLEVSDDSKSILSEKLINVVMELIHYTNELPSSNFSDYLTKKLDYDYTYLANIFSEVKGITLQQFIIIQKIERVKELLLYEDQSLTKIAGRLHYSSVAHLSNQFKKITGLTPIFFKQMNDKRVALEDV